MGTLIGGDRKVCPATSGRLSPSSGRRLPWLVLRRMPAGVSVGSCCGCVRLSLRCKGSCWARGEDASDASADAEPACSCSRCAMSRRSGWLPPQIGRNCPPHVQEMPTTEQLIGTAVPTPSFKMTTKFRTWMPLPSSWNCPTVTEHQGSILVVTASRACTTPPQSLRSRTSVPRNPGHVGRGVGQHACSSS